MRDERLDTLPSLGQVEVTEPQSGERQCLSTDEILGFAQGCLGPAELTRVHAHVDRCATCQRLLSEAVHALTAEPTQQGDDLDWNTMFLPNAMVAQRYRIQRFIARGGMGEVYEAYDGDLQERVALKTVASTACDSPRAVRRLKAEVQMARRVSHPNVCRIYDLGGHALERTGALVHFLTMEFIDGEPLGQRLRGGGPLPLDQAQSIARQLLQGLRAAHRAGILHRDFKSDNVMLRGEPAGELTPVILDFGLARLLDADPGRLTSGRHQGLVGTLSYMAPEQIEGQPLTASSDLYAFGVVWFEMLTGRLPFEAETAAAAALERLHRQPAPPSSVNPEIPVALDQIVLRCLSRFAVDRFQSADEVLAALDAPGAPQSQSIPPAAVSSQPRSVSLWFRTAAAVALAGALGVAWSAGHRSTTAQVASGNPAASATAPLTQTSPVEPDPQPAPRAVPLSPGTGSAAPSPTRRDRVATRPTAARAVVPPAASAAEDGLAGTRAPAPSSAAHALGFAAPPPTSTAARSAPKKMPDWEDPFP